MSVFVPFHDLHLIVDDSSIEFTLLIFKCMSFQHPALSDVRIDEFSGGRKGLPL